MQIIDLLSPSRVVADATAVSKKRLIELLAKLLDERATPGTERALFDSLVKREKLGSTGLGNGVAIPHGRSAEVNKAIGAFVRLKDPVDFNAVDGKPVDLVFSLIVPEQLTDQHLLFLARIAEMFSDQDFLARLRSAKDADALYRELDRWSQRPAAA
jgi:PTS system nitrogen regulatory IIA component